MFPKLTIAILFSLFSVSLTQVTEGCARYTIDQSNILRCVQCFYTMGLTSSYTCEYCKAPKVVADGICKLPAAYLGSVELQPLGNGQANSSAIRVSDSSSNSNLQTNQAQQVPSSQSQAQAVTQQTSQTQTQNNLNTNPNVLPSWQNTNQAQANFDSWGSSQNSEFGSFGEQTTSQSYQPATNPTVTSNQPTKVPTTTLTNNSTGSSTPTSTIQPNATQSSNSQQNTNQISTQKYPQFPNCIDYENGQCWACAPGYLLNLIINQCTTYVKPPTPVLSSSSSSSSSSSTSLTSKDPLQNCNIFSQAQSKCSECFRGYFWSTNQKVCKEVDRLCNTYNPQNGQCLSCYNRYSLSSGKCIAA